MESHPDRHQGDTVAEKKFKEINEAYEVLKDPQKKAAFDRYGSSAFDGSGGGSGSGSGFGNWAPNTGNSSGFNFGGFSFEDILGDVFGFGNGADNTRTTTVRGDDIRTDISISLEDAFFGKTVNIAYRTFGKCEKCDGSGSRDKKSGICPACKGAGSTISQQGFISIERTCSRCKGRGSTMTNPCQNCNSSGRVYVDKNLEVKIPRGIQDGSKVRLSGEGEAGVRGGQTGDLFVFVSISKHSVFQRSGYDLICSMPISMVTAALGAEVEVVSMDKQKATLKIPAGAQTGDRLRVKGKGMPVLRGSSHGDLLVDVVVETPVKLTKKQKDLLLEFETAGQSEDNSPKSSSFFCRLKDFFERK
jgi:molecular chaperone DnaJ